MDDPHNAEEKSIPEQLQTALAQLSTMQIKYVVARQSTQTVTEAANEVGIKPDTVYRWPKIVKEAVRLMAADGLIVARHILHSNVAKAAMVKAGGLDSKSEKTQQDAATDILDRAGLKEPTRFDITSKGKQVGQAESVGEAIAIIDAARTEESNPSGGAD